MGMRRSLKSVIWETCRRRRVNCTIAYSRDFAGRKALFSTKTTEFASIY